MHKHSQQQNSKGEATQQFHQFIADLMQLCSKPPQHIPIQDLGHKAVVEEQVRINYIEMPLMHVRD